MTVYLYGNPVWEESDLRNAFRAGRISGPTSYIPAEWDRPGLDDVQGWVAVCYPDVMPGDSRDPQHQFAGPFPTKEGNDLPQGLKDGWLAVLGPPTPLFQLFPEEAS